MAPPSLRASAAMFVTVGLGVGRDKFRSGISCFANSSDASTGNWVSGYGTPNVGPKRNAVHANSLLILMMLGRALGGAVPRRTSLERVWSKPERARETWSGT